MNVLNLLGFVAVGLGGMLWMFGGNAVRRKCKRRMGEEPLLFDGEVKKIPFRDLNDSERWELFFYAAMALVLMMGGLLATDL